MKTVTFVLSLLLIGILAYPVISQDAETGLVAYWKFDDGSGNTASDSSGNGHNGTLIGDPQWTQGRFGKALEFDQVQDKVQIPYHADLNPDTFTVMAWVNVAPGTTTERTVLSARDDSPQRGYILYAAPSAPRNKWLALVGVGSGWRHIWGPVVNNGDWEHIAVVYADGKLKLYVNGENVGEADASLSVNTAQELLIGAGANETPNHNFFYKGKIDEVRIYDRELSEDEIANVYNMTPEEPSPGTGEPTPPTPETEETISVQEEGLVAHWAFEDKRGTTASDSSGNGHNGILLGDPQWTDGYFGGGPEFDQVGDEVNIPFHENLNLDTFTVTAWVNVEPGSTGYRAVISSRDGAPFSGYVFYCLPANIWSFWIGGDGGWKKVEGPAANIGEWEHLAGTVADGEINFYVNGKHVGRKTSAIILNTTQEFLIGASANELDPHHHFFKGKIDEVRVYDYELSADEITNLYNMSPPVPVELSSFRPTLEDGKVTIQWTTESELDNAGFNILRSDSRNGEFTQVNERMIQGKGTTAERTTYKWVDTTAKPGAIYYYQIEDVSFAGERTTLAINRLKGLISAKGKLTTQWGDLKNLR